MDWLFCCMIILGKLFFWWRNMDIWIQTSPVHNSAPRWCSHNIVRITSLGGETGRQKDVKIIVEACQWLVGRLVWDSIHSSGQVMDLKSVRRRECYQPFSSVNAAGLSCAGKVDESLKCCQKKTGWNLGQGAGNQTPSCQQSLCVCCWKEMLCQEKPAPCLKKGEQ